MLAARSAASRVFASFPKSRPFSERLGVGTWGERALRQTSHSAVSPFWLGSADDPRGGRPSSDACSCASPASLRPAACCPLATGLALHFQTCKRFLGLENLFHFASDIGRPGPSHPRRENAQIVRQILFRVADPCREGRSGPGQPVLRTRGAPRCGRERRARRCGPARSSHSPQAACAARRALLSLGGSLSSAAAGSALREARAALGQGRARWRSRTPFPGSPCGQFPWKPRGGAVRAWGQFPRRPAPAGHAAGLGWAGSCSGPGPCGGD